MPSTKKSRSQTRAVIKCHRLPLFETSTLEGVKAAFQDVAVISGQQKWRKRAEPDFAQMLVQIGWCDDMLLLFAELTDTDIFTHAKTNNQRLWELGDAFEVFLRPRNQESYVELQVAPNNKRLQLRYPNSRAVARARKLGTTDHLLIRRRAFVSSTWVSPLRKNGMSLPRSRPTRFASRQDCHLATSGSFHLAVTIIRMLASIR